MLNRITISSPRRDTPRLPLHNGYAGLDGCSGLWGLGSGRGFTRGAYRELLFFRGALCAIAFTVALLIIILLTGCSPHFTPICRHNAALAYLLVGEQHPVRLMYGINKDKGYHVQTQAFIGGQWKWLNVVGGEVYIGEQDPFDGREVSFRDALKYWYGRELP